MKFQQTLLIIIFLSQTFMGHAQDVNSKILLTVDGKEIPAGEFIHMFKKSYDSTIIDDLDNYVEQFIVFKIKVTDAVNSGYDTLKSFKNELNGYRNELAANYLIDGEIKNKLLQQEYKRSLTELNAWHILINCPPDATPEDSIKAWDKAFDIRERIMKGEPFEQVARGASEDPSVALNGGNLGYFTAFQMIMPFEDAAYNLKLHEVSMPVRTPYGYHIIKLEGTRPSRGQIKVAHIMKAIPTGAGKEESQTAERAINKIYQELIEGAAFEDLAMKESDDKESAGKNGELPWFSAGEIITDFAEASFSLKENGDLTKPFKTFYGWHIVKRLDLKPPASFEESKPIMESKISKSYLNTIGQQSLATKLKDEYNFRIIKGSYDWFVSKTDTLIVQGLARYNRSEVPNGYIYQFADQNLPNRNFADFIAGKTTSVIPTDSSGFVDKMIDLKSTEHILEYENSILEDKYPEFRYLMNEFHDGMLLFEISAAKVWNKVSSDTVGLMSYFEEHKNENKSLPGIYATIYSLEKENGIKLLKNAYNKKDEKNDFVKNMSDQYNKTNDSIFTVTTGTWFEGDNKEIDNINWTTGVHEAEINGIPSLVVIREVYKSEPMPFENVVNEIVSGYQEYLEKEWIKQLKAKYPVKVNNIVLEEIRREIYNE